MTPSEAPSGAYTAGFSGDVDSFGGTGEFPSPRFGGMVCCFYI
ncbi:hypothetical protein CLOSTHATH_01344 [Hungatella hathewayi DSM 13479]|uniref:Uncharacterized protein n=1 Tax=Hungatella hathewayi DSM 13479 TaxID=566550 RepID=D3ACL6_9FIRM|nr:hypothetical protein CLOSTHATH_01344 [Hungatella hathewayi DSM 13479]